MFRTITTLLTVLGLSLFMMLAVPAGAEDDDSSSVALKDVPESVQKTLKAAGEVGEVEKGMEDGKVVYEAEIKKDGKEFELTVDAEGKILEKEMEVSMKDLPAPVREVLEKFAAAGEVEDIEMEEEGGKVTYSAEIEIGEAEFELELDATGKIVEVEADKKSDDNDDDNDADHEDDDDGKEDKD